MHGLDSIKKINGEFKDSEEDAFSLGKRSGAWNRLSSDVNPFPFGSPEYHGFSQGFAEAGRVLQAKADRYDADMQEKHSQPLRKNQ